MVEAGAGSSWGDEGEARVVDGRLQCDSAGGLRGAVASLSTPADFLLQRPAVLPSLIE
jgi:hypothetical protein